MVLKVPKEKQLEWLHAYEDGACLDDLSAIEAAQGKATSGPVIKAAIVRMGGVIRTMSETMALKKKLREEV